MKLHKQITKWISVIPWKPDDIIVTVDKGVFSIEAKDKKKGAKNNEKLFEKLKDMAWGAEWFTKWVKEQRKR